MNGNKARPVKTTLTSIKILQLIKDSNGATMAEISKELDLATSTIHNHLSTLEAEQFLVKEGEEYHIGLRNLEFGEYARNREPLYRPAKIQVYRLAEATNEEANFTVDQHGYMYTLEYVMGDPNPQNPEAGSQFLMVGSKFRMHNSSPGKAILSAYSDSKVEMIIDTHGLPGTTENTITEKEVLQEELERIRERGYATDDEELKRGYRSIAIAITSPNDSILGALSIGGPAYRFETAEPQVNEPISKLSRSVEMVEDEIREIVDSENSND